VAIFNRLACAIGVADRNRAAVSQSTQAEIVWPAIVRILAAAIDDIEGVGGGCKSVVCSTFSTRTAAQSRKKCGIHLWLHGAEGLGWWLYRRKIGDISAVIDRRLIWRMREEVR